MLNRRRLGKTGEALACRYLRRQGYAILARNYSTPLGEIDIIAEDGNVIVFVEVKTRRSGAYGLPEEAVDFKKMHKLMRLAAFYLKTRRLSARRARFDIVSIMIRGRFQKKSIKLIKNAFCIEE